MVLELDKPMVRCPNIKQQLCNKYKSRITLIVFVTLNNFTAERLNDATLMCNATDLFLSDAPMFGGTDVENVLLP